MTNSEDEGVFEDFGNMSDEELQEAFAAGKLKPGLNIATEEKVYRNNAVSNPNLTSCEHVSSLTLINMVFFLGRT